MDIQSYISSGILELYVIGTLSESEIREVELMAEKHPEIRQEIFEISKNLEKYAKLNKISPSPGLEEKLFSSLPDKSIKNNDTQTDLKVQKKGTEPFRNLLFISGIGLLLVGLLFHYQQKEKWKNEISRLTQIQNECDSLRKEDDHLKKVYAQMLDTNTQIVSLTPTENYNGVRLSLYYNPTLKSNTLYWNKAPQLQKGQVFQLWYFDGNGQPKPLETFTSDQLIRELSFIENAKVYAFTIEPEGGSQTPTLSNLLGTASIP